MSVYCRYDVLSGIHIHAHVQSMPTSRMRGQRESTGRVLDAVSSALFLPYAVYAEYAVYARCPLYPVCPLRLSVHSSQSLDYWISIR
jgi:hypothetical protein